MDNVLVNKFLTLDRCVERIQEEYTNCTDFKTNYTVQDSVILNLERLCQACIDIGTHIIRVQKFGIIQNNRSVFQLLEENKIIDTSLSSNLQAMVGFRNIAVHDYQSLNLQLVLNIIQNKLSQFAEFKTQIQKNFPC